MNQGTLNYMNYYYAMARSSHIYLENYNTSITIYVTVIFSQVHLFVKLYVYFYDIRKNVIVGSTYSYVVSVEYICIRARNMWGLVYYFGPVINIWEMTGFRRL